MNEWLQMILGQPGAAGAAASTARAPLPLPMMPMQGLPPVHSPMAAPMRTAEALDPNSDEAWNMRMRQALDDPTAPHTIWPGLEPSLGGEGLAPMRPQNDNGAWPPVQQVGMKDQGRMGLDTQGLAQLSAEASRYWPMQYPGVSEAPGQLLPPPTAAGSGFVGPGSVGPRLPVETWTLPERWQMPTRAFEGVMDANAPVGEDEYRALIQRLFQQGGQGRPGSTWR